MSDLFISDDRATVEEEAAVNAVLTGAGVEPAIIFSDERLVIGGVARRNERRHLLLPCLHALQTEAGWISPGGLNHLASVLAVPPAEAYGVATFYDLFRADDPGHREDVVHVCVDAACQIAGSAETISRLTDDDKRVHPSPCLGQCERPVGLFVQGRGRSDRLRVDEGEHVESPAIPQAGDPGLRLLRRVGVVDPSSLADYLDAGGYRALDAAVTLGSEEVIAQITASGLMGRGGAAFPTGVKWSAVANEDGPKHVVVNADESEPGTFKDRVVMESDPFAIVEAATIAGFAVGATKGWIYIRGEYPLATERLQNAISQAYEAGYLGLGAAGSEFGFDLEIRRGAGAYICGEETALFNSLEGFRGEPRQKPPFPTTNGLFGKPTVVNNPETLLNVLDIVVDGGEAYAAIGTDGSNGTKLFCLSGHVAVPGLYEVPFGATLGDLLDLAGGTVGSMRAVLLGGAAGSFVGPEALSMPLTFEGVRAAGLSLGSGVIMAFNDDVDFKPVIRRIAEFFRGESCGQCVPCRIGTQRQHEILSGDAVTPVAIGLLDEIDRAMKDASICGLGHTAATAVRSAIDLGLMGEL